MLEGNEGVAGASGAAVAAPSPVTVNVRGAYVTGSTSSNPGEMQRAVSWYSAAAVPLGTGSRPLQVPSAATGIVVLAATRLSAAIREMTVPSPAVVDDGRKHPSPVTVI